MSGFVLKLTPKQREAVAPALEVARQAFEASVHNRGAVFAQVKDGEVTGDFIESEWAAKIQRILAERREAKTLAAREVKS